MNLKEAIAIEFEFRVFEEAYPRIYRCLSMIDDSMVWKQPNEHIPSIGNNILHLCGNARQWILSGLGDKVDNRERDQEFIPQQNIKKSELIFLLENLKSNLRMIINSLDEKEIQEIYSIQGFNVSGFSVLAHVLEHFSYHTGQITILTKLYTGRPTGFYSEVDLNKRNG